jgi:hypothetical protein
MATKKAAARPAVKIPALSINPKGGGCGYKIATAAKAGMILGMDECAFTTYALEPGPAIALPEPTVAFYGPGDRIVPKYGAATVTYYFVAGVIFKNC